jgi:hypothetical protein
MNQQILSSLHAIDGASTDRASQIELVGLRRAGGLALPSHASSRK